MKFLSKLALILIPTAAMMNFVTNIDEDGVRCMRLPQGWVCQD